jgi:hypothetical protein
MRAPHVCWIGFSIVYTESHTTVSLSSQETGFRSKHGCTARSEHESQFEPTDKPKPDLLAEEPDDIHMVLEL